MTDAAPCPAPLASFVKPLLGMTAWGVKQGHGSFLTFEFGQPQLNIVEHASGTRRSAYVHGQWHVWITCCHWTISQNGERLARSEDDERSIARATAALNGQNLVSVDVPANDGRSSFRFDLGGVLETSPYGDDPAEEQWMIRSETEVFSLNASGRYAISAPSAPVSERCWTPLR